MTTAAIESPSSDEQKISPEALLRERFNAIVGRLQKEADDRVAKRSLIEDRWLTDLRQYHGKYDDQILSQLKEAKKSTLFINQTRAKTNACEARLSDMLFPTDDRNWGIEPTPVPELTVEAEETAMRSAEAKRKSAESPEDATLKDAAATAESAAAAIQARLEEARKRARAMEEEIDDHLRECRYGIQSREVIRDGCRLGTGIMKGPVVGGRMRRSWALQQDESGASAFALAEAEDNRPVFWRTNPWAFFPDMDATSPEDGEGNFERHLMNPKELRRLARQPGFDKDAIRRLLNDQARSPIPTYLADLRTITGTYVDTATDRYHVWEYNGSLSADDMADLSTALGDAGLLEDIGLDGEEVDPLQEINVVLWFCQGEIVKLGIHQLDSGDSVYSVFCLEKDEASIFGFGVPYIMRDSQKALNAGWRTMMDNGGLSSGPQVEIDEEVGEPVNGIWALEPRKVWRRKTGADASKPLIRTYNIESHQEELANIIEMAKQFIDDETMISTIAQGEQGTHTTQTAHGMSILMNSVNVVFRRIVKNWDDDMTTPNIRRLYDWLMQFSPKEHIKGDYEVDARGTSVLLVREMQSANLNVFLSSYSGHPLLGKYLKKEGLPALRRLVQTMMIPADEVIKSNEEIAEDEADAAENPPPPNPEMEKIVMQGNIAERKVESARELELLKRETALIQFAATANLKLDELRGLLGDKKEERASKERIFAAEVAIEERNAARAHQAGEEPQGSGGYVSV